MRYEAHTDMTERRNPKHSLSLIKRKREKGGREEGREGGRERERERERERDGEREKEREADRHRQREGWADLTERHERFKWRAWQSL